MPVLGGASAIVLAAFGVIMLIFSIIEFGGGAAYEGRSWYGSMIGGIPGFVTFFTLPLDLIGTLLIALGEGQFATKSGEEPAERE